MSVETIYNEQERLMQIAEGNGEAFRHLFEQYYGMVYSLSFNYLKVHDLAEDVVQHSFLKVWEKRAILPTVERFDNFLFMIARNELTDQFHKQNSRAKYLRRIGELFEEEQGNPEELLISKQKRILISQTISSLPPQQQTAYQLSRDKGLSYNEIADEMHISVNTVRKHITVALAALRDHFKKHREELMLVVTLLIIRLSLFIVTTYTFN